MQAPTDRLAAANHPTKTPNDESGCIPSHDPHHLHQTTPPVSAASAAYDETPVFDVDKPPVSSSANATTIEASDGLIETLTANNTIFAVPYSSVPSSPTRLIFGRPLHEESNETPSKESGGVPFTPRRLSFPSRLSLQMPARPSGSPVLDPALGYSVARRPRIDFARACTSLHHSTLAEQSSPESSPLAPSAFPYTRRGFESPISNPGFSLPNSLSESAIPSDDSDSTEEDTDLDFNLMIEASRSNSIPSDSQGMAASSFSLFSHPRSSQLRRNTSKNSSRSGSASNSVMQSPSPTTPPVLHSSANPNYFIRPNNANSPKVPDDWRMSDSPASSGGSGSQSGNGSGGDETAARPVRPDPIRRAVSRRADLHPKPKSFQRIRAYLQEEASPGDMELRREAEITRQLRDEDEEAEERAERSAMLEQSEQEQSEQSGFEDIPVDRGISFQKQAQKHGGFFFDAMDLGITGLGTSPPTFPRRQMDGDIMMDSPSTTPISMSPDIRRGKRRRDDRFEDPINFKRRAVSPSVSGSPILGASSPVQSNGKRLNFQGLGDTNDGLLKMSLQ